MAYTIDRFCAAHDISRSMLETMWKNGVGPKVITLSTGTTGQRRKVIITAEAAAEWRRSMTTDPLER